MSEAAPESNKPAEPKQTLAAPPLQRGGGVLAGSTLWFNMGYRIHTMSRGMPSFSRQGAGASEANKGCTAYKLAADKAEWSLGIDLGEISLLSDDLKLINPFIRVHIVSADTGKYAGRYHNRRIIPPISTSHSGEDGKGNLKGKWSWQTTILTVRALFSETVVRDNIILFEILDMKTSILMKNEKSPQSTGTRRRKVKRIAWAFLLPVGGGDRAEDPERCNVGILPAWNIPMRRNLSTGDEPDASSNPQESTPSRRRGRRRGGDTSHPSSPEKKAAEDEIKGQTADRHAVVNTDDYRKHFKEVRLQLFEYKSDNLVEALQRSSMGWPAFSKEIIINDSEKEILSTSIIPEVYLQWRRQKLSYFGGVLHVSLGPSPYIPGEDDLGAENIDSINSGDERDDRSSLANDEEDEKEGKLENPIQERRNSLIPKNKERVYVRGLSRALKVEISRRSRTEIEPCLVPTKLLCSIEVGPLGAMSLSFAHCGSLLAVAGPSVLDPAAHSLALVDTDTGKIVWRDGRAHHGVIYQLRWALNDAWLVSCAADGTAKVWDTAGIVACMTPSSGAVNPMSAFKDQFYMPFLAHTLVHLPVAYVYCALFQEFAVATKQGLLVATPRVITGSSDGRIRVYQDEICLGQLGIKDPAAHTPASLHTIIAGAAPHAGTVNDLTIDCRSRNLFSADSVGSILVWRLDSKGWYQILRKLKTEQLGISSVSSLSLLSAVNLQRASLANAHSQQMLVLAPPSKVAVFNTSTYRPNGGGFPGLTLHKEGHDAIRGVTRAALSSDGRLAISGSSGTQTHSLIVWEASSGNAITTSLSALRMPYPVRSIAWHPTQHVIAIAMVGTGAAIGLYFADRETTDMDASREGGDIVHASADPGAAGPGDGDEASVSDAGGRGGALLGSPARRPARGSSTGAPDAILKSPSGSRLHKQGISCRNFEVHSKGRKEITFKDINL